jgi:transcriptional regulator with XRE-family HTH domain
MDRLRTWLEESGTSQKALAEALGVTQANVSYWLRGQTPRRPMLLKLSEHTGLSIDELLSAPSVPPSAPNHVAA